MKDKEVSKSLITALGQMKREAEEYQDKKLWKEITLPQTYEELLQVLSKDELHEISRHYGFKNISALKKNDLVNYLVKQLPYQLSLELPLMDEHRYLFLKQFVSENDKVFLVVQADTYDNKLASYWRKTGLIFSGSQDGQKVLFMPSELQSVFQDLNHEALQNKLKQNTEWLLLTYGMLYYYGVLGTMKILSRLEELTGIRPDHHEFHTILLRAGEYYGAPKMDSYRYWAHQNVQDIESVLKEHQARHEVDYYRFSNSKLLKAGQPNYFEDNPAFQRLSHFLFDHYDMTEKEAKQFTQECQHIVNQINKPTAISDFLKTKIEFPDDESVQRLADVVMFFWNNTRQWTLKGHSPAELATEAKLDIIDLRARQKVGRNAPCPCGSGKKFKQCCGRL